MTFEQPIKGDLDRALSLLMHDHRHKLMEQCNLIKSDAAKVGALHSNRVVVMAIKAADDLHREAMTQALTILLDYIGRMPSPPAEIVGWARPHLENLGNSLLGVVPPNNFPQDHQRLVQQYRAVFGQRLDGMLRDVEIGFVRGAGFARAEQMESTEQWLAAAEASRLLKAAFSTEYLARKAICKRAHEGLIRARAERYVVDQKSRANCEVPKEFWWAAGAAALTENWTTGDFETWINQEVRMQAFGVSFSRTDIQKLVPERVAMAVKKRPGNVRDLSELAGSMLLDVREDFSARGLSSRELTEHYVGVSLADLQQKYCTEGEESQVDFDLALKELETALFVGTGPMVPFDNKPGSGFFVVGAFSKREYVYLTEAGYRAASQMANQKPRHASRTHVHISGGTFHQSQIGIGDQVTQMQSVDIDKDVGNALTTLTQAVERENSMPSSEREALLEQIAYLKEQAANPAKDRKLGMIKATLGAISQAASTVASVASAWQTAAPLLKQYFGS